MNNGKPSTISMRIPWDILDVLYCGLFGAIILSMTLGKGIFIFGAIPFLSWQMKHYEKLCLRQLDCPTTKAPNHLTYNCIATIPWKYDK